MPVGIQDLWPNVSQMPSPSCHDCLFGENGVLMMQLSRKPNIFVAENVLGLFKDTICVIHFCRSTLVN